MPCKYFWYHGKRREKIFVHFSWKLNCHVVYMHFLRKVVVLISIIYFLGNIFYSCILSKIYFLGKCILKIVFLSKNIFLRKYVFEFGILFGGYISWEVYCFDVLHLSEKYISCELYFRVLDLSKYIFVENIFAVKFSTLGVHRLLIWKVCRYINPDVVSAMYNIELWFKIIYEFRSYFCLSILVSHQIWMFWFPHACTMK